MTRWLRVMLAEGDAELDNREEEKWEREEEMMKLPVASSIAVMPRDLKSDITRDTRV